MQDASKSSSAHPSLPCPAVSATVWMLVGALCPMWEPQSCIKRLPEEFPSLWLGFAPGMLFLLSLVFFTYALFSVMGLGPLFFPLLQKQPIPAAPLAFPSTWCCRGWLRDPPGQQRCSERDAALQDGWERDGGEHKGAKGSGGNGHWGRRGSALHLNPVRSFVSRIGFDGAQMGTIHAHKGKTHHLARGKADLAGVTGAVKLRGCKTSAANKCLRAWGMREGGCGKGDASEGRSVPLSVLCPGRRGLSHTQMPIQVQQKGRRLDARLSKVQLYFRRRN